MISSEDLPKMLGDKSSLDFRLSQVKDAHVAPLNNFVLKLRSELGPTAAIPYFDPWDGGVDAKILFLLEAPGPKAVNTGFVSRNNPDETANNFYVMCREAGIPRKRSVVWNIVPWYIGDGKRIRAANAVDINSSSQALEEVMGLLPELKVVVFLGKKHNLLVALLNPCGRS